MPDISVSDLRDEVLDRLDNLMLTGQINETIRQKIKGITRVTRSMNYALDYFVRVSAPESVSGLIEIVSLAADTNVGDDGVQSGVKTWLWPAKAFQDREDGGLLTIILDEREYPARSDEIVPINTLRMMANNVFYKDQCARSFNIDPAMARIYTGSGATAKARIIGEPFDMNDTDQYVDGSDPVPTVIPIQDTYLPDIAAIAVRHLLEVASRYQTEQLAEETKEESE